MPNAKGVRGRIATLAPLLHWRVCHVWDWLRFYCPDAEYGGFTSTKMIADAYGGDEAEEVNARTGCIGCPLASQEKALETVTAHPDWAYLEPLHGLKPLYRVLREPRHRLRKREAEVLKDGTLATNPQRMGPLTFEAREMALARIIDIQHRCNVEAEALDRPRVDILNAEEIARIRALIAAGTWPDGWGRKRACRGHSARPGASGWERAAVARRLARMIRVTEWRVWTSGLDPRRANPVGPAPYAIPEPFPDRAAAEAERDRIRAAGGTAEIYELVTGDEAYLAGHG